MPLRLLLASALALLVAFPAQAQRPELQPRFGGGFDGVLSVSPGSLLQSGIGIGVRGRVSFPVNADLSVAADAGLAGFFLSGRDGATYLFNPQISGIVTMPALGRSQYVLGGLSWYAPLGAGGTGGPAIHGGLGWVTPLQESALYFEVNPALVIGQEAVGLVVPARVGVIF